MSVDFQDLYDNAPCGYLSFLDDGTITQANQTLLNWLKSERSSMTRFQDLVPVGERIFFETQIAPILRLQNSADEIQFHLKDAGGVKFPVLTTTRRSLDAKSDSHVNRMSLFQISDRKKFEMELKHERGRAEASAKSKTDFLSMLSHEIGTPLNAVIGVSNLLDATTLSPEQEPFMEMLRNSSENLMSLLNSILDLSKIESGKMVLEKKEFDTRKLFESNVSGWQGIALKKKLRLSAQIDSAIPKAAIGDPVKITQVLSNLLGNAIKFTSDGSVTLRVKLMAIQGQDMVLRIEIEDTGIGINETKLASIFEEFSQADFDISAKFGGTGLGLTISQKIVDMYGSRIDVKSIEGKGSTFGFELKLAIGNPKTDTLGIERVANQAGALTGLSVLVADDSTDNLELMKHLFKKWGAKIETARNGKEALEKISRVDYDVVLMDVRMPVMSGYDATKAIRALDNEAKRVTPVIAFSGSTTFEGHDIENEGIFHAVIGKPFKPLDLIAKLIPFLKA